jgi:hypothetical protein
MIIKITRENSSYRERERERERERKHIYLYIFVEINQPTNQHHCEQALTYQDWNCLQLTRLESSARSLARSSRAGFVWSMHVWRYFLAFEKKNRNRNRNLCETRTWSFVSIPLQNRVGCERASVTIPFFPSSSGSFVASSSSSSSSRLKGGQTACVPGCSYVPYVPTYHVWHFF